MARASTALVLLAASAPAFGHDTWLLPALFEAPTGARVDLDLTSGMDFPRPETAVKPERLAATGVRFRGRITPLDVGAARPAALRLTWSAEAAGIATLWAESKPRTLSLKPEEIREYLREVGAWETVGRRWEAKASKSWRESYVKVVKSFVQRGAPEPDDSWKEPVGLKLEIVPEKDPTTLRAGEVLPVRVLLQDKPLAGITVGALSDGGKPALATTDAEGGVSMTLDRPSSVN